MSKAITIDPLLQAPPPPPASAFSAPIPGGSPTPTTMAPQPVPAAVPAAYPPLSTLTAPAPSNPAASLVAMNQRQLNTSGFNSVLTDIPRPPPITPGRTVPPPKPATATMPPPPPTIQPVQQSSTAVHAPHIMIPQMNQMVYSYVPQPAAGAQPGASPVFVVQQQQMPQQNGFANGVPPRRKTGSVIDGIKNAVGTGTGKSALAYTDQTDLIHTALLDNDGVTSSNSGVTTGKMKRVKIDAGVEEFLGKIESDDDKANILKALSAVWASSKGMKRIMEENDNGFKVSTLHDKICLVIQLYQPGSMAQPAFVSLRSLTKKLDDELGSLFIDCELGPIMGSVYTESDVFNMKASVYSLTGSLEVMFYKASVSGGELNRRKKRPPSVSATELEVQKLTENKDSRRGVLHPNKKRRK